MAVEHGVVRGSNKEDAAGNMKNNGFLSLAGGASTANPPNTGPGGDHRGGSFPLGGSASLVNPPNARRFSVGDVEMPQPASAIEPGKGAVPVNPFLPGGAAARALPVSDMAPKR
jgi:hypothetical protein